MEALLISIWVRAAKRGFILFITLGLLSCSTTFLDKKAFEQSDVRSIGIVISSGSMPLLYNTFPFWGEVFAPLPVNLEKAFNEMALLKLRDALASKGYSVAHLKSVHSEWDLYSNISDSVQSYNNLLRIYGISPSEQNFDAILFVEYLLQPKGFWHSTERVSQMELNTFEVAYANSKLWLYNLRTGARMFYALKGKGYEQVFSHVTPDVALNDILSLADIPHTQEKEKILEK